MNRHTKLNILWRSLLVAMLMAFCNTLSAEETDRQRADELNRQVDLLMAILLELLVEDYLYNVGYLIVVNLLHISRLVE